MSYDYATQRANLFTEGGNALFLKIYENAVSKIKVAGAVRMDHMWEGCSGESWDFLACADRLVELGKLREITSPNTSGQHRVFVGAQP